MQKIKFFFYAFLLFGMGLFSACVHTPQNLHPDTLNGLQNLSATETVVPDAAGINRIRSKALEDTAMSLGAQGGLAFAAGEINKRLEKDRWYLDTIYNFNGMMLSHGVLPPILAESSNNLNLADENTLRISDKTYQIIQQARFATVPPNWRNYIWLHYSKPELPDKVLLPRNSEERKAWRAAVQAGWEKGIEQAYSIFQQNLARLKRDYNGMILYRKLLQQHMVSAPFVSRAELGVTGDGNNMHVNDQVLRITAHPQLQTDTKNWRAIAVKVDD